MLDVFIHEINYQKSLIERLEAIYHPIHASEWLKPPVWDNDIMKFRYEEQSHLLLMFLKGIRYLSLLNAAMTLFEKGHCQEMYILCRCMDEAFEDALLFTVPPGENGELSRIQQTALDEFYQEEFEDYFAAGPDLKNIKRHRTPREKIRKEIDSGAPEQIPALKDTVTMIHKTFSGYVHGAYPHIMELYGGNPARYHIRGMRETPRVIEAKDQLTMNIYRGILFGRLAAKCLGMGEHDEQLVLLRNEMEKNYPSVASLPDSYKEKEEA
ncbi:MAG: hypothetical protein ACOY15_05290 [Pseudomonadota bacterium]